MIPLQAFGMPVPLKRPALRETPRGPRGLRKVLVQDLGRLYRLRREIAPVAIDFAWVLDGKLRDRAVCGLVRSTDRGWATPK